MRARATRAGRGRGPSRPSSRSTASPTSRPACLVCCLGVAAARSPGQLGCEVLDPGCSVEEWLSREDPSGSVWRCCRQPCASANEQRRSLVPAPINAQSGAADPRGGAQEQAPLPTGRRLIRLGRSCGGTRGSLGVSCRLTALEFSCPRRARPSCGHLSSLRGPFLPQKSTRITF